MSKSHKGNLAIHQDTNAIPIESMSHLETFDDEYEMFSNNTD